MNRIHRQKSALKSESPKPKKKLSRFEKSEQLKADMNEASRLYDEEFKTIEELARQFGYHNNVIIQALNGTWGRRSERYRWTKTNTSEEDVLLIHRLLDEGKTYEEIAKELKISRGSAHRKANKMPRKKTQRKRKGKENEDGSS